MKHVELLLEEDEIMLLRASVRMIPFFSPEENELLEGYVRKILSATSILGEDYMHEIGKMQRAMRKIRATDEFSELMNHFAIMQKMIVEEMSLEGGI